MDRIDAIKSFVRAVETGSFSQVARERGTTQPTISKQVAALEDRLGVQLLARTTRSVTTTEAGARYYEAVKDALEAFEAAEAVATDGVIRGTLRVGSPVYFGQAQIIWRLPEFLANHPDLKVDLVLSDAFLDPVESGVDLAVRIGELTDSALVARRVGTARRVAVASPDYLKRKGEPASPEALRDHDCVLYTRLRSGPVWTFRRDGVAFPVRIESRVSADGSAAVLAAILAGLGIGLVPSWLAGPSLREGGLVQLLDAFEPEPFPIHLVSPPRRHASAKTKLFSDHLAKAFKTDPDVRDAF